MNIKKLIPLMMMVSVPLLGLAQKPSKSGIMLSNLDRTVSPSEDFYAFACGGWMKNNPLPAAFSRYGSFDQLQENNNKRIADILASLQKKKYSNANSEEAKLSVFYQLAMDSLRREREGLTPVRPLLQALEGFTTFEDLHKWRLTNAAYGFGLSYGAWFGADEKDAKMNIFNLYQSGLSLSQRDYYVKNDSSTVSLREAFKQHIERMFKLYGFDAATARARRESIFRFETALALVSKSATELRNPQANYNKMTLTQFNEAYPHIRLAEQAKAEGIDLKYIQTLVVGQPAFFEGLDKLIAAATLDDLRALAEWDVIMSSANYLTDEIREANFDFFGRTMSGRKVDFPLWKRASMQVEAQMGEALGKIYVKRYFPESSKKMMETLVQNLIKSMGQRIDAQSWMSDATKAAAHHKLDNFYVKIGYPNKWKDFSKLQIDAKKSYFENILACRAFANAQHIEEKAGKPVDRDEWGMTPQTVNAYYNPTTNEICFPAGILQYPFFDPKADAAFNYGAIGVVIGHEITHGFDDQGRQYDADGNMKDWWTAEDAKGFDEKANAYADFFSNIKVLPDLNANGKFTLGENLADHGGLMVSFNAFKMATAKKPLSKTDGFTPEQRFFLAYSGVWANNITEKEIRKRTAGDPHSLGKWRVNGALPHIDMWYDAFDVKANDKMFLPEDQRLDLW